MAIGSGISAQFGFKDEVTWATAVTVDHFAEFNSESMTYNPDYLEGRGLHAGGQFVRNSRVIVSRKNVTGSVAMDLATNKLGLLLKHALGSGSGSTPVLVSGSTYKQVHTPGPLQGFGLTTQVGKPQTDGTVKAFTYNGCKVLGWEVACDDNTIATLSLDLWGQNETTATGLAAASYTAGAGVFNFSQATVCKLGGTASTVGGIASIAGGVQVASIIKGFSLKGTNPHNTDRYGLGNAGVASEPIENDLRSYSLTLHTEFTSETEIYDVFKANTTTAFQLTMTNGATPATSFDIVIPALKYKKATPVVSGPDIVGMDVEADLYDDGTNAVVQLTYQNTDAAL